MLALNPASDLRFGLCGLAHPGEPLRNVAAGPVSAINFAVDGGIALGSGRPGTAYVFDGSTTGLSLAVSSLTPSAFTMFVLAESDITSGTHNFCSIGNAGAYAAQLRMDGTQLSFYQSSGGDMLVSEAAVIATGRLLLIHAIWDGTNQILYRNGVQVGTRATASCGTVSKWNIGEDNFGAKQALQGKIYRAAFWRNYALTPGQVKRHALKVDSLFQTYRRRWAVPANAASSFNPAWARNANTVIQGGLL